MESAQSFFDWQYTSNNMEAYGIYLETVLTQLMVLKWSRQIILTVEGEFLVLTHLILINLKQAAQSQNYVPPATEFECRKWAPCRPRFIATN